MLSDEEFDSFWIMRFGYELASYDDVHEFKEAMDLGTSAEKDMYLTLREERGDITYERVDMEGWIRRIRRIRRKPK